VSPIDTANDYWLRIYNTDSTNFVSLSVDGGSNYKLRVPKGKSCLFYILGGTSVYRQANTAACIVEQCAIET
jgi:hypothetical protein